MRGGRGLKRADFGVERINATNSRFSAMHPVWVPEGVGIFPRYDLYRSKALITLILDLFVLFKGSLSFLITRFFVFLRHLLHVWLSSSVVFTGVHRLLNSAYTLKANILGNCSDTLGFCIRWRLTCSNQFRLSPIAYFFMWLIFARWSARQPCAAALRSPVTTTITYTVVSPL